MPVPGLSPELFPQPSLPCPCCHFIVTLASVGLFGWDTPFARGPSHKAAAVSQIAMFLVQSQERGLAQTHRPHVVSSTWPSYVCPGCAFS